MPHRFLPLACLLLLTCITIAAADETEDFMRAQALVNWTYIVPAKPLEEGELPSIFQARIRRSGKLQSLGLPVRVGDQIMVKQLGPYVWSLTKGNESINVNTYNIPAEFYPRFR